MTDFFKCFLGSADSKTKKDSRNKSMFSSLFKKNVKEPPTQRAPAEEKASLDPKFTNVEFKFKQQVSQNSIQISISLICNR